MRSMLAFIINHLIKNDPSLNYSDFAVLYRTNELSRNIEDTLVRSKVPYIIKAGISFYARREIRDMIAFMNLLLDPNNFFYFKRVINIPKRGIGIKTIEKIINISEEKSLTLFEVLEQIENQSEFSVLQKQRLKEKQ